MAAALLPLSYAPELISAESWSSYRTQAALTALVVLYAFFALQGTIGRLLKPAWMIGIVGAIALVTCMVASQNVLVYFVIPESIELATLRGDVARVDLGKVRGFYLRCARTSDSVAPAVVYDEFGFPSTANWGIFEPELRLILRAKGLDWRKFRIKFANVPAGTAIKAPTGMATINMEQLAHLQSRLPVLATGHGGEWLLPPGG